MQPTHTPARDAADLTNRPVDGHPDTAVCQSCGAPNPFGSPCQATRRLDGRPETDADRRLFDLRNAGYLGPIDQDGHPTGALVRLPGEVVPVTVASTLRAAARYLSVHGWCQGSYYDQTATVFTPAACMVGAIGMACYGGPVDAPAQHFNDPGFGDFEQAVAWLDRYLNERYDQPGGDTPYTAYDFNDAKDRTTVEVIAELLHAADAWDNQRRPQPGDLMCCGQVMQVRHFPMPPGMDPVVVYSCATCQDWAFGDDADMYFPKAASDGVA